MGHRYFLYVEYHNFTHIDAYIGVGRTSLRFDIPPVYFSDVIQFCNCALSVPLSNRPSFQFTFG